MLTSTTATSLPGRRLRSGRLKLGAAAGGVLLAAVLGTGIAVWQIDRSPSHPHTVIEAIAPVPAAAGGNLTQAATRGGVADSVPLQPAAAAPVAVAPQVVLVDSAEQADEIRGMLSASDPLTAANGASPLAPQVIVVDPERRILVLQMYGEENQLRGSLGLPSIVVTDLSQPPAEPVPAPAGN